MKIQYNIALAVDDAIQAKFKSLGVSVGVGFEAFQLSSEAENFLGVLDLARKHEAVITAKTLFSNQELSKAKFLKIQSQWHFGYPEPSSDFGYLERTYNLSDFCKMCGTGKVQKEPFSISKQPHLGAKNIFQMNWIFDEYFVERSVWKKYLQPLGIDSYPLLFGKTDKVVDSVVQLNINDYVDVDCAGCDFDICTECGRRKYSPISEGHFPKPICSRSGFFKSKQGFGSGALSSSAVIVSDDIYRILKSIPIKGIDFVACCD